MNKSEKFKLLKFKEEIEIDKIFNKKIFKYLENIKLLLKKYDINPILLEEIKIKHLYENKYIIECDKKVLIDELNKLLNKETLKAKNIQEFAFLHDTHNKKLKKRKSYLIYKNDNTEKLLVVSQNNKNNVKNILDNIIIIENQAIFELNYNEILNYIKNYNSTLNLDLDYTIIFGSGQTITSTNLIKIFNNKNILYFGDIDDKGYEIFLILKKNINADINFILPDKKLFYEIQKKFQNNISNYHIKKKLKKIEPNSKLYNLLQNYYQFKYNIIYEMQQEIFLI